MNFSFPLFFPDHHRTPAPAAPPDPGHEMFRVDVRGLRRKFAHRPKSFLVHELYQNAVDEDVTMVRMTLERIAAETKAEAAPDAPVLVRLVVEDDSPEGFKDLSHSYTMYADSSKLDNPEQRGIWNLGEKLVLAFCEEARITTTKGTVRFRDGRRFHEDVRSERGTTFEGTLWMRPAELEECASGVGQLIPPGDIAVFFNGVRLVVPPFLHEFTTTLPTTLGDGEGAIRRTRRKTAVRIYEPLNGGPAMIFEMGIPVVETGDKWHYDVQQRVPLNMQRDNVTPAYLQELRVAVFNHCHHLLGEDDVKSDWSRAASNDKRCAPEAITRALDLRFGTKRVSYDVRDPEANKKAMAEGYTVVHGGAMSKTEWANARQAQAIQPAGKVTPSNWPEPAAMPVKEGEAPFQVSPAMQAVEAYVHRIAAGLIDHDVNVRFVSKPDWPVLATFGRESAELTFNAGTLGERFFADRTWAGFQEINELILHEFAHEYASDHFTREFYDSVGRIGARLVNLGLQSPGLFAGMVTAR